MTMCFQLVPTWGDIWLGCGATLLLWLDAGRLWLLEAGKSGG